jgi:hypothetical protein
MTGKKYRKKKSLKIIKANFDRFQFLKRLSKKKDSYYKELMQVSSKLIGEDASTAPQLDLVSKIKELSEENGRLNELVTKCQDKMHSAGLEVINSNSKL